MKERELLSAQEKLLSDKKEWCEIQAEYNGQSREWHDCELEKQKIEFECDDIRRELFEMGCCD